MTSSPRDGTSFHFSSHDLPARERVGYWREVLGRSVLRLDIEPVPTAPFYADVKLRVLDGVAVAALAVSGMRERRTRELIADGNDMFGLAINLSAPFVTSHGGHDAVLGDGEAVLVSMVETGSFMRSTLGRSLAVSIPRAALIALVPAADDVLGKPIRGSPLALRLLTGYLQAIGQIDISDSPELQGAAAAHICDLIALIIGAPREAAELAQDRGLRAARLTAIKAEVARDFRRADLSAATIAPRYGVTARQVQRLFEADGTTLSEYLLACRLDAAYRMLTDARFAGRSISAIAFEVGFGDLSYFNRTFRRRYGAAPSELRPPRCAASARARA